MRFLFFILFLISVLPGISQVPTDSITDLSKSRLHQPPDSTIAPVKINADPKEGFKDLYIAKPEEEGLNQVQLNVRAISFVDDYMKKTERAWKN